MAHHKFKVGQLVIYSPGKRQELAPPGDYKVTRLLPIEAGDFQYRIKNALEPYERSAGESQLAFRGTA